MRSETHTYTYFLPTLDHSKPCPLQFHPILLWTPFSTAGSIDLQSGDSISLLSLESILAECISERKWKLVSRVWIFVTHRLIQSMEFSRPDTGVGSLSLLQGIFPIQGSNPGLLHCRQILYHLSHKGSKLGWVLLSSNWCYMVLSHTTLTKLQLLNSHLTLLVHLAGLFFHSFVSGDTMLIFLGFFEENF